MKKEMSTGMQLVIIIWIIAAVVGVVVFLQSKKIVVAPGELVIVNDMSDRVQEKLKKYEKAKELTTIDGYLNVGGITIQEELDKKNVVLLDIWTYSCINCQRTLPYIQGWYEKYKDQGLTVIGLHTPEFEFEKDIDNVKEASEKFGLTYPIVLDNDFSTWKAYRNQYWPRKYLIDVDGFIVYDHIGEGGYDETERKIQELLEERKEILELEEDISTDMFIPQGVEVVNSGRVNSPETYFGAWRNETLGNGEKLTTGVADFVIPEVVGLNTLYLGGTWNVEQQYAESVSVGSKIVFKYNAQKVFLVMSAKEEVSVRILIDGKPISGDVAGQDVVNGVVKVNNEQLYRLIENSPVGEHVLEIIIDGIGVSAFAFTFG